MSLIEKLLERETPSGHPVSIFLESKNSIERLSSHFRRSTNRLMQKYVSAVSSVLESYSKHPTDAGNGIVSRVGKDCREIMEASQRGDRELVEDLLPVAYGRASEFRPLMDSFSPIGRGTSGTLLEDEQYEDEHNSFCKKFCKEFGVDADHHEAVAEGLFIYFNPEDTKILSRNHRFELSEFCFENGYILLKTGSVDDFSFGSFGENLSKWGFVYLPDSIED